MELSKPKAEKLSLLNMTLKHVFSEIFKDFQSDIPPRKGVGLEHILILKSGSPILLKLRKAGKELFRNIHIL